MPAEMIIHGSSGAKEEETSGVLRNFVHRSECAWLAICLAVFAAWLLQNLMNSNEREAVTNCAEVVRTWTKSSQFNFFLLVFLHFSQQIGYPAQKFIL